MNGCGDASNPELDFPEDIRDIHIKTGPDGRLDPADSSIGIACREQLKGSEHHALLEQVASRLPGATMQGSFRVALGRRLQFRAERYPCRDGEMTALRRLPEVVPDLSELSLPHLWEELFLSEDLCRGGLILVVAPTGSGKSVTLASIGASRLRRFGGYMTTVEDPIEMPLHGWHGRGKCVQTAIDPRDDPAHAYIRALRSALRVYPTAPTGGTMLLFGEVRDQASAAEVLRAANQGHLVLTTVHGSTIESALRRLIAMASRDLGQAQAQDLAGAALRIIVAQSLTIDPRRHGFAAGVITGTLLYSSGEKSPVAGTIRDDALGGLAEHIDQQSDFLNRPDPPSLAEFLRRFRR